MPNMLVINIAENSCMEFQMHRIPSVHNGFIRFIKLKLNVVH